MCAQQPAHNPFNNNKHHNDNDDNRQNNLNRNSHTNVKKLPGGYYRRRLEKTIQKAGDCDRKRVHTGDRVVYHYVGYNEHDMSVFDSSFQRTDPYVFKMGERTVIQGVDLGLHGACVGERLRLSIPPHLGYEDEGTSICERNCEMREWRGGGLREEMNVVD